VDSARHIRKNPDVGPRKVLVTKKRSPQHLRIFARCPDRFRTTVMFAGLRESRIENMHHLILLQRNYIICNRLQIKNSISYSGGSCDRDSSSKKKGETVTKILTALAVKLNLDSNDSEGKSQIAEIFCPRTTEVLMFVKQKQKLQQTPPDEYSTNGQTHKQHFNGKTNLSSCFLQVVRQSLQTESNSNHV
jgi:hypothetical protein